MLPAVLSDGTAVNIVRRGDDIVIGGVSVVTLVDENGGRHILFADVPVDFNYSVEARFVGVADGLLSFVSVVIPSSLYDGYITLFDCDNEEPYSCPEVLDWLCRNYGLRFSPVGLFLYESVDYVFHWSITGAFCDTYFNVFCLSSSEDDFALAFPSGSNTLLGCDGSAVESGGQTRVPSQSLENIRSSWAEEYQSAYNTWLFYLSTGLPKSVFDEI